MTLPKPLTIREAYLQASSFLADHLVNDPAICAEIMLQKLLQLDRTTLLLNWERAFPEEHGDVWRQWVLRKAAGEPVQYITGEQEFYGLTFQVTPAVLIPRPETELLVEAIVRKGKERWAPTDQPLAVDIGTGSGAIIATLVSQCPSWKGWAVDLSGEALLVAQSNARRLGVADRIEWLHGDLLKPVLALQQHQEPKQKVNILVSNPPYITTEEMKHLQREVAEHEPVLALHGGQDGMDSYRQLIADMRLLPELPELIGFEVGHEQAEAVASLLDGEKGWGQIEIVKDLAGISRHVLAYDLR
ncbi:peptide chain release factor N(5)-glutamine methyltransferase [Paenibacillus senegalensis]|uniref:peptide chain release factor N(5)-glutamine methyltransferase n=1 Tax=Paenibacillus senegalensis TaxID=1465766 RepID=UPI000289D3D1|nr:peptide chain release factor N(5)-glutamine methyltransferase [Paenibacillus senegalensis]